MAQVGPSSPPQVVGDEVKSIQLCQLSSSQLHKAAQAAQQFCRGCRAARRGGGGKHILFVVSGVVICPFLLVDCHRLLSLGYRRLPVLLLLLLLLRMLLRMLRRRLWSRPCRARRLRCLLAQRRRLSLLHARHRGLQRVARDLQPGPAATPAL